MDENLLRKKVLNIGEGSFEKGVEAVYSSFIGLRRNFGVSTRFRDSFRAFGVLFEHELAGTWEEFRNVMNYLVENPVRYSSDTSKVTVNVERTKRGGLEGYTVSRKVLSKKPYVY